MCILSIPSNTIEEKELHKKISIIANKLKKDKKALFIITVGLIGMILILFSGESKELNTVNYNDLNEGTAYDLKAVKQELTQLIESINGAGKTIVMITYRSDEETVFATDSEDIIRNDETKNKKEYVIVKNNSNESGIPIKIIYPEVQGVAVICEGGDNQVVKEKIYSLVCALFSISSNSVSVASMK